MALKVETCTVVTAELQLPLPLLQMCLTASTSAVNVRQTYRLNEHYSYKIVVLYCIRLRAAVCSGMTGKLIQHIPYS